MYKIIALGKSEFILGFRLSGIEAIETDQPETDFKKYMENQDVGIIITDEDSVMQLSVDLREKVEEAVKPVTVVLSTDATSNEALRKKIKKSIGVDLWSQ
ncbi:V-type ATP synthase subunit F [Candidatus Woesearchaeota archaeon CG10_big_fil_rev_8_21_14_0_10_34_8]|nr:MAG: V-type ATP synthase subunit F [Candidatus Woesearchaeota archaeon CG10_big_fil_rev_8_21_14_0_10_34_8]